MKIDHYARSEMLAEMAEVLKKHLGSDYVEAESLEVQIPEQSVTRDYDGWLKIRTNQPVIITFRADHVTVRKQG